MYPVTVKKIQDNVGDSRMWISVDEMAGVVMWDIATLKHWQPEKSVPQVMFILLTQH
jgi:hypothetical protein